MTDLLQQSQNTRNPPPKEMVQPTKIKTRHWFLNAVYFRFSEHIGPRSSIQRLQIISLFQLKISTFRITFDETRVRKIEISLFVFGWNLFVHDFWTNYKVRDLFALKLCLNKYHDLENWVRSYFCYNIFGWFKCFRLLT